MPNFQGTAQKIGISTDIVKTNKYGDFGTITRAMRDDEKTVLQQYIEQGYDLFVTRCAEGRNIPKDTLMLYAEGRVWTGNQAKEIGLIDELGGINDAINIAADLADLGSDFITREYPKQRTFIEELLNPQKDKLALEALKEYVGDDIELFMLVRNLKNQDFVQARLPFDFAIK